MSFTHVTITHTFETAADAPASGRIEFTPDNAARGDTVTIVRTTVVAPIIAGQLSQVLATGVYRVVEWLTGGRGYTYWIEVPDDQGSTLDLRGLTTWGAAPSGGFPTAPGGGVASVNGKVPDQDGNVALSAADVGAQPGDPDLTAIAALIPAQGSYLGRQSGAWTGRTPVQVRTDIGLSNVDNTADVDKPVSAAVAAAMGEYQPLDSDLTTIAGLNPAQPGALASDGAGWVRKSYAALKIALTLTKGDVGLSNVDDTADTDKPVSNATSVALGARQPLDNDLTTIAGLDSAQPGMLASDGAGWARKGYATVKTALGLTKGDVGLSNVDDTADTDKPISNATSVALGVRQPLDSDLTVIAGLDSAQPGMLASDGAGWVRKSYTSAKAALGLVKSDVGLGSVDNTSDANKPVSTATQTALDVKAFAFTRPAAGNYFFAFSPQGATTSNTLGNGTLRLAPWLLDRTLAIDRIGAEVLATVGEAGSKVRLGIYADNGNCYPGSLVLDAGQIAGDSAAIQELTVSVTMQPGLYWIGGCVQSAPTTQPNVRVNSNWTPPVPIPTPAIPGTSFTGAGVQQAGVSTFPSTFTTTVTATLTVPRVFVRAA